MPTPSAITGSVATLTPMPSATISASHSTEVITSGTTATTTARQLRKVMKHSTITARVDEQQHLRPGLAHDDVGRRLDAGAAGGQQELALGACCAASAKSALAATTRSSVSARWSAR